MTRQSIATRILDELETWQRNGPAEAVPTVDDLDVLCLAFDTAIEECRGFLDDQFHGETEPKQQQG